MWYVNCKCDKCGNEFYHSLSTRIECSKCGNDHCTIVGNPIADKYKPMKIKQVNSGT